jgi:hemolysin activation/secretion protein
MLNEFRSPVPAGARAATLVLTSALVVTLLPWPVTAQEATPAPHEGTRAATPQPKLDRATGKLQVDRGGARITGKLPAPARNGAARVSEVSIRGNTAIPVGKLRAALKTRTGEPFDPARWEQDLQAISRLYQDQGYQVRLESAPLKDGKVRLTLREVRVGSVTLKGFGGDAKERAALLTRLKQKAGGLYNSKQLQDDFRTLQETKRFETINPTVEVGEDQKIVITWELQENKK